MAWKPQLNAVCGRCGKPREGLRHVCRSNSRRSATVKPKLSFGKCGACGKPYGGNPLAHTCAPKSDFRQRQKAAGRRKPQRERHDYQACNDRDCPRSLCVAFKTGWRSGFKQGYDDGYGVGWSAGYPAGYADGLAERKSAAA